MTYDEASRFLKDLFRITANSVSPEPTHVDFYAFVLSYCLFRSLARQATAALILIRAGHAHESTGLRRSALEYATSLQWLAASRQAAVDVMNSVHDHQRRTMSELVLASKGGWSDGLMEAASEVPTAVPSMPGSHMMHMAHRLVGLGIPDLRVIYAADTRFVHPSVTEAQRFVRHNDDGTAELLIDPDDQDQDEEITLTVLTLTTFSGAAAVNELMPTHPWSVALKSLGDASGYPVEPYPAPN